jgi:hypothetical protein
MSRYKSNYSIRGKGSLGQRRRQRRVRRLSLVAAVALVAVVIAALLLVYARKQSSDPDSAYAVTHSLLGAPVGTLAPPETKAYGIAAGSSLIAMNDQELNARLQAMADLGITWVRYDFDWSIIQPDNAKSYDWSRYDKLVAASNAHHLRVLGILDYTPAWARSAGCGSTQCNPANSSQFATFAGAVAERYKSARVNAWEVWNEPNSKDFWQPAASPGAYAALLQRSYAAIKRSNAKAYVLTGGLSPQETNGTSYAPIDFLQALYTQGARPYFDGVADHPYTFPLSPTSTENHAWNQMAGVHGMRAIMVANGDSQKKLWITEFGSPTGGPGALSTQANPNLDHHPYKVDEALQAKILADATALYASYDWAGPFFVYSLQDAGTDQSTNENFFGLLRYDGTHKPAYDTYKAAVSVPLN